MTTVNDYIGPVHNTHLTTLRRCARKFGYAFVEGIQPRMPGLPLARGSWLHYCLQAQWLRWGLEDNTLLYIPETIQIDGIEEEVSLNIGDNPNLVVWNNDGPPDRYDLSAAGMLRLLTEHVWNRLFDLEKEKYTEDGHTLPEAVKRILEEYFYFYREEFKDRDFEILLVEVDWQRAKGVEFEGRTDYVIRIKSNGLIVCGDWKSTKTEPHAEYKFMESQLHLYPWGIAPMLVELGIPKDDVNNMAVEFDYLSTKLPTKPSQNKDGSLSKRKINTTYLTLTRALKEYGKKWNEEDIEKFLAKNEKQFFVKKRLPRNKKVVAELLRENVADSERMQEVIENPDKRTRTQSLACSWDCDFLSLCMGELYGQDVRHIRKTEFEARTNTHAGVVDADD